MKLLHIDSSPLGAHSVSRSLTRDIAAHWQATHHGTTVDYLDLAVDAPSHLDMNSLAARVGIPADQMTAQQKQETAVSEKLLSQFLSADVIVVGAPMFNFSVPSQLKAWIDRIAQAGRTFQYTPQGPKGLVTGKTVIVASTRGGMYAGIPERASLDHQEAYLRTVFGFLGITDVRFVRAEGVSMGDEVKAKALAEADAVIKGLKAAVVA